MAKQTITNGQGASSVRSALNSNFTELYTVTDALSTTYVGLTGNQTIAGDKAFSGVVSAARFQLDNLDYSTIAVGNGGGGFVGGYNIEYDSGVKAVANGNSAGVQYSFNTVTFYCGTSLTAGDAVPVALLLTGSSATFVGALTGTSFSAQASGTGKCTIQKGTASNTGFVEWIKPSGDRSWYLGYNAGDDLSFYPTDPTNTLFINAPTNVNGNVLDVGKYVRPGAYTVATLPSAAAAGRGLLVVSDRGNKLAYSDGGDWRFVFDNSVVS